jgi:gentisate 1,2-dioxygenase
MVRELDVGWLPALEAGVSALGMTPGWIRREVPILWKEMKSAFVPHQWKYAQARQLMVEAARMLGTDVAERATSCCATRRFMTRKTSAAA